MFVISIFFFHSILVFLRKKAERLIHAKLINSVFMNNGKTNVHLRFRAVVTIF
jgi:hypothetical protein